MCMYILPEQHITLMLLPTVQAAPCAALQEQRAHSIRLSTQLNARMRLCREVAEAQAAQQELAAALAHSREAAVGTAAQMADRQKKFLALNSAFRRKETTLQAAVEAAQASSGQAAATAAAARREAAAAREASCPPLCPRTCAPDPFKVCG